MRRRLTKWPGVDGAFSYPALKPAIRLAIRAVPRQRLRKSAKAVTGDVLAKLLATCATDSLRDLRDRAILMVAIASGGRRRSEIAGLRRELSKRIPEKTLAIAGFVMGAVGFSIYGSASFGLMFLIGIPIMELWSLAQPSVYALMSKEV